METERGSFLRKLCFSKHLALLFLLWAAVPAPGLRAEPFGSSGGIKNESDVAVKLTLVFKSEDYQSLVLAAGASLDFPEETALVRVQASAADPPGPRSRIRIAVIQPDGSRQELRSLESEAVIYPMTGKFPKQDEKKPLPLPQETMNP